MRQFKEKSEKSKKAASLAGRLIGGVRAVTYTALFIYSVVFYNKESPVLRSINIFSGAGDPIKWIRLLSLAFFIFTVSFLLRLLLRWIATWLDRGKAMVNLLVSFVKYSAAIVFIFLALQLFGVDTATLLAGIGILSLIVGLGAQPLIEDILSGLFIVFEGIFEVGDIIVYDGFRGTVREIGIRTTQIVDTGGNIKVINNSDIRTLTNLSEVTSVAVSVVSIAYGADLIKAEEAVRALLQTMPEKYPNLFQEIPTYAGVDELSDSSVDLKVLAKVKESNIYGARRALNRELKLALDEAGIEIPFPQVVVWQGKEKEKDK